MAIEFISDTLRVAGKAMLQELDAIGLQPQGALWLHFNQLDDWRLTIISDLVDIAGRTKVYALVDKALQKNGAIEGLTIFDVHLASSQEIFPRVLGGAIHLDDGGVSLEDCIVNGIQVNAYVYRLRRSRNKSDITRAIRIFESRVKQLA